MTEVTHRLRSPFARQALRIYLFQGIGLVASLISSVVVARTLGPEGKGTVDLFLLLASLIVEFAMLGIASGLLYQLANQGRPLAEMHGDVLAVALALGVIGVGVAVTAPALVAGWVGPLDTGYAALALALTGVWVYSVAWSSLVIGVDRAPLVYQVQAAFTVVNTLVVVLLWMLGSLSAGSLIAAASALVVAQSVIQFAVVRRLHAGQRINPAVRSTVDTFAFGIRIFPGQVANWLHFRVDQIVIANMIGLAGVGTYALSVRWAELLWVVGYGLLQAGVFRIAARPRDESAQFAWRLFRAVLLLTGAAGIVMAILALPLISTLYGPEFEGAIVPLIILIPGVVAWDASRSLSNNLSLNRGKPLVPTTIAIFGAGLNLLLTLLAVPRFGLVGAAAATTVSYVSVMIAVVVAFRRTK